MAIYITRRGDTPASVAARHSVSVSELRALNALSDPQRLTSGLALLVPGGEPAAVRSMELAACAAPGLPDSALSELLPSLTWLCGYVGGFAPDGRLLAQSVGTRNGQARRQLAVPLLTVSNLNADGGFSGEAAHRLLADAQLREIAVDSILKAVEKENFGGVNVNFQYLFPFDRDLFTRFAELLSGALHAAGRFLMLSLAPEEAGESVGHGSWAQDMPALTGFADRVTLLACDWCPPGGPPQPLSNAARTQSALFRALEYIPARKLLLALSPGGMDWTLPWRSGSSASSITPETAVSLAVSKSAAVSCDAAVRSPYYAYTDARGQRHSVWYDDIRTVEATLRLVSRCSLAGLSWQCPGRPYWPGLELLRREYALEKLL